MNHFLIPSFLLLVLLASCDATSTISNRSGAASNPQPISSLQPTLSPQSSEPDSPRVSVPKAFEELSYRPVIPFDFSVDLEQINPNLITENATLKIIVETEVQVSLNGNCRLTINYPRVEGLHNASLQTQLNQALKEQIFDPYNRFFQNEECAINPKDDVPRHLGTDNCLVKFAEDSLISVACHGVNIWGYVDPHVQAVTFSLETGKIYSYSDLFDVNSNYLEIMDQLIIDSYIAAGGRREQLHFIEDISGNFGHQFYLANQCENRGLLDYQVWGSPLEDDAICIIFVNQLGGASRGLDFALNLTLARDVLASDPVLQVLKD